MTADPQILAEMVGELTAENARLREALQTIHRVASRESEKPWERGAISAAFWELACHAEHALAGDTPTTSETPRCGERPGMEYDDNDTCILEPGHKGLHARVNAGALSASWVPRASLDALIEHWAADLHLDDKGDVPTAYRAATRGCIDDLERLLASPALLTAPETK